MPTQYSPHDYAYIGYRPDSQNFGDVVVDEFRVYDRVLTPQEIAAIYTAPSSATCNTVGTEESASTTAISVYPNPTTSEVTIQAPNQTLTTYTIINTAGQVVESGRLTNDYTLELHHLPNGFYFLNLKNADGKDAQHKITLIR